MWDDKIDLIDKLEFVEAKDMKIEIQPDGIWYHGSNKIFSELRIDSTITQWKELARADEPFWKNGCIFAGKNKIAYFTGNKNEKEDLLELFSDIQEAAKDEYWLDL